MNNTSGKAVKKPVAIDWFLVSNDNLKKLNEWIESFGQKPEDHIEFIDQGPDGGALLVKTLEGHSYNVPPGYFILRGIEGEYYPCEPKIFEKSYNIL